MSIYFDRRTERWTIHLGKLLSSPKGQKLLGDIARIRIAHQTRPSQPSGVKP